MIPASSRDLRGQRWKSVGSPPSKIVIEITERASIVDYEKFEALVRHYARQGFDIALDDFGSGNSGLRTLIDACRTT